MEMYFYMVVVFLVGIVVGFFIKSKSYKEIRHFCGGYQPDQQINVDRSKPPRGGSGVKNA